MAELRSLLIPTDDFASTLAFFKDFLKLPPKFVDGERYAEFDLNGLKLGLLAGEERIVDATALGVRVDNVEAALASLDLDAPVLEGPHERRAVVKMPGGAALVVYSKQVKP